MREEDLHGLEVRAVELTTTLHKTIQEGLADHEARLQDLEDDTDYSADLKKRISKLEVQMAAGIKLWKQLDLEVARLNRLLFAIHAPIKEPEELAPDPVIHPQVGSTHR